MQTPIELCSSTYSFNPTTHSIIVFPNRLTEKEKAIIDEQNGYSIKNQEYGKRSFILYNKEDKLNYLAQQVLEIVKSNSSRLAFLSYKRYLRKFYWYTNYMWSRSYFVSTVGNNFDIVTKYIRSQS